MHSKNCTIEALLRELDPSPLKKNSMSIFCVKFNVEFTRQAVNDIAWFEVYSYLSSQILLNLS